MAEQLATDAYSVTLAQLLENPGVLAVPGSTINLVTFLRNSETWFVQTVRADGKSYGFLQRIGSDGGQRWVLPPEVLEALYRQDGALVARARRRGAAQALATKKERGQAIGNPAALEKARKAPRKRRARRRSRKAAR